MSIRKKTQHGYRGVVALGLTSLLLASACVLDNDPFPPTDAGTTPGPVTPGSDAGTTPVPQQDGSVSTPADAGTSVPVTDAAVPAPDSSTDADAGLDGAIPGDASSDDGSVDDGSVADASLNDGSVADASLNDGSVADAAVADAQTDANTPRPDLGKGNGKDVITIGDSWMEYGTNNGGIQAQLEKVAGSTYRKYAKAGAKLFKDVFLVADAIPKQYANAKRENRDIKTVVMTGGGNDVLLEDAIDDCGTTIETVGPKCKEQIRKMGESLRALWQQMGADGVKDVVYIEYSSKTSSPGAVLLGAAQIAPICAAASPVRCHFLPADDHMGRAQLLDDDPLAVLLGAELPIHPNEEGCKIMAKAAYDLMVSEGMRR